MAENVEGTASILRKIRLLRQISPFILNDPVLIGRVEENMRRRFRDEVAPDGKPWPVLTEERIKRKRRRGSGTPEKGLQDTGRLLRSFRVLSGSNAGLFAGATGIGVRIGIVDNTPPPGVNRLGAADYGRLHNYGLAGQKKRQFIGLSPSDLALISESIRRKLNSIAGG